MYFFSWKRLKKKEKVKKIAYVAYDQITLEEAIFLSREKFFAVECDGDKRLVVLLEDY